jgi:hypothetical protein
MKYARRTGQDWVEVNDSVVVDGVTYPYAWMLTASPEQLSEIGVAPIVETDDPPADVKNLSQVLVDSTSGPVRQWNFEPYTVAEAADIVRARADAVRDAKASGGCDTPFGRVDTTDPTKIDMVGAVLMAMLSKQAGKPFSIDWTMADKTVQTLDADGMTALGLAVGEHRQDCQNASTAIRSAIDQAAARKGATAADIFAIDIQAGHD